MRHAGYATLAFLSLAVAAYAIVVYGCPPGSRGSASGRVSGRANLHDDHDGYLSAEAQAAVRHETRGEDGFEGVQRFLEAAHVLAAERRLSRFAYLARKAET